MWFYYVVWRVFGGVFVVRPEFVFEDEDYSRMMKWVCGPPSSRTNKMENFENCRERTFILINVHPESDWQPHLFLI